MDSILGAVPRVLAAIAVTTFLLLFLANLIITAVYLQIVPPKGS
mgnify:CR=1 FL=1